MKRILFFLIALNLTYTSYGQSTEITPGRNQLLSDVGDNLTIRSNATFLGIQSLRFNGTLTAKTPVLANDDLLRLGAGGYYNSTTESFDKALIRFVAAQNWSSVNRGTKIQFLTTQNNGSALSERMVIDHDGEVGIGATDPQANLHVNQTNSGALSKIKLSSQGSGSTSNDGLDITLFSTSDLIYPLGAGILNKENNSLLLGTNNTYFFNINSSGNIGIGNFAPSAKLHINHLASSTSPSIHLQSTGSSSSFIRTTSTSAGIWENHFLNSASAAGNIVYWTNSVNSTTPLILTGEGDALVERNVSVGGFTNLGTGAPKIKMKELSGTFSSTTGSNTSVAHGLTQSKILAVQVFVNASTGNDIGDNYPSWAAIGFEYSQYLSSANVILSGRNGNDASLLGRPVRILITYKE